MIIRITRLVLLLQAVAACALGILFTHLWPIGMATALPLGIAAVLLLRFAINVNNFLFAIHYADASRPRPRLGWAGALRLLLSEFAASMITSSWNMPFQTFQRRSADPAHGPPVLLLHGYGCNSGYWHAMSAALRRAGITHYALDLEPVFGGIDDYVPAVARAIEGMCRDTGQAQVVIVAHSMGGLVAHAYLRSHGGALVAKVVTLGTPYAGTGIANVGPGRNARQMRLASAAANPAAASDREWLQGLMRDADPAQRALFVSLYSLHDNIVSPAESAHLEGARNIAYAGIGHVALGLDRRIHAEVIEQVLATGRAAPASVPAQARCYAAGAAIPHPKNIRKDFS